MSEWAVGPGAKAVESTCRVDVVAGGAERAVREGRAWFARVHEWTRRVAFLAVRPECASNWFLFHLVRHLSHLLLRRCHVVVLFLVHHIIAAPVRVSEKLLIGGHLLIISHIEISIALINQLLILIIEKTTASSIIISWFGELSLIDASQRHYELCRFFTVMVTTTLLLLISHVCCRRR